MARPSKTAAIDYAAAHDLTHGILERATCPDGRPFVLLKDSDKKGLRLRVTQAGGKHWQFETRLRSGKLFTRALGEWPTVSLSDAREEAHRLRGQTEKGTDPRELERQQAAAMVAQQNQQTANAVTVTSAWSRYTMEGSPKRRDDWKPRYIADMAKMVALGGKEKLRGQGLTLPGHLAPLMGWRLSDVTEDALTAWFKLESRRSKHQATRALMMFRGFLRWCSTEPALRGLVNREAGKAPAIMDNLPEAKRRTDALEAAQVPGWWSGATQLSNLTASAYLRALVLTGARREEMAALKWSDVDFRWHKLTIADKVGDTRTIPLTAYLSRMLATLPRGKGADGLPSPFVFASASKSGRLADPRSSHEKVLLSAGVDGLTLHGLRRSFSLLGEAAGAPAGAIAQVMGHRPSATAEGYRPRSVDALRPFLQLIEDYILALAGVEFDATAIGADGLRLVAAA